jgi:hypothetical protein
MGAIPENLLLNAVSPFSAEATGRNGHPASDPEGVWKALIDALENNPNDTAALLGLSQITADLSERLSILKRAFEGAPENPEVKRKLTEFVILELAPKARTAAREEAVALLVETVSFCPDCEPAWFCLAYAIPDESQRRLCLEQILRLNPDNRAARDWLASLDSPLEIPEAEAPGFPTNLSESSNFITGNESLVPFLENSFMANVKEALNLVMEIEGTVGAALADWKSGMCLGTIGGTPTYNLEIAAAGNTEVVRAKMKAMANLGIKEAIEDILITLDHQFHLIRIIKNSPNLFFYVAIKKETGNLALARHKLSQIEANLTI